MRHLNVLQSVGKVKCDVLTAAPGLPLPYGRHGEAGFITHSLGTATVSTVCDGRCTFIQIFFERWAQIIITERHVHGAVGAEPTIISQ